MRITIRLGQIWKQKNHGMAVLISGHKGGKWKCKTLGKKPGFYKGSHTMSEFVLRANYELCE